jgi:hypothetical protein
MWRKKQKRRTIGNGNRQRKRIMVNGNRQRKMRTDKIG